MCLTWDIEMAGSSYSHFVGTIEKHVESDFALHFTFAIDTRRPARITTNFGKNSIAITIFHNKNNIVKQFEL